jgi:iron complex transport system substrate-binding protein
MKRLSLIISLLIVMGLILSACAPALAATPTQAAIALTDGLGRQVTLAGPAQKIVSLAPSNTEILFALGAGAQVIGRDELSDYPGEAKKVYSIGSTFNALNLEEITKLQPDLVLAAGINTPEQVKSLENLKLTVFYLANPKDLEGLYTNLETVGQLTGHQAEAKGLVNGLRKRVQAVVDTVAKATTHPKVFYELDATDPSKPWTSGPGTFIDRLITMAGGVNIGDALKSDYAQLSLEEILVQNPDIILLGDAAYGMTPDKVKERTGWAEIKAVKGGKLLTFDDNLVSRPGPRMVDGLEQIARLLHPELFK